MGSLIIKNFFRFLIVFLLQAFVLMSLTISYPVLDNINIIIYPVVIMMLPLRTPNALILLIAFVLGILLDLFYNSPGVHASATVLIAFMRPYVLSWLEPRGGYTVESSPTMREYGSSWFILYASILLFIHLFFLFSVQAFTFVYILEIFLKTVMSFIVSMIFILIYMYLFNPKE